eukprot:XP_011676455.1 PREDICTED: uncharacterized protein LOC105444206 [Strongylocentrotus purpuratus]
MASKFQAEREEKDKLRNRKGHNLTWSCDIHGEPIAFYCKEHGLPVCDRCAIKDHQKQCNLDNIGYVIWELARKLDDKQLEIEETKPHLQNIDSKIQTCSADARNHLQSIDDVVNATFESKIKNVKDKKQEKIRSTNEEADELIRKINEKREKRIKTFNEEAEQQQIIIKESLAKVLLETNEISEVVSKKIQDLTSKNQHAISTMNSIDAKIKRIKQDDKTLVNEAPQVLASLDDNLSLTVHQDVSDCLDRIQREVQRLKFVEGEVGGDHYGRIDGYIGKWKLVKSIPIPSIVGSRRIHMKGLISDDEICVQDVYNSDTYVTNISTEHTEKVTEGDRNVCFTSCAPLDSNVIVCGKDDSALDGLWDAVNRRINIYDRQWKLIRDITIPRNTWYNIGGPQAYVDVDRDGMILAAQGSKYNIYVINPADGKIVNTIAMQDKEVRGRIQALSSGDIVVTTDRGEFTVISRLGDEKAVIHYDDLRVSYCHVDKRTDKLYITYRDVERTTCAVDEVSCDGIIQARRIVEYEISDRAGTISPFFVTPSGSLVNFNGDFFCVYRKMFCV